MTNLKCVIAFWALTVNSCLLGSHYCPDHLHGGGIFSASNKNMSMVTGSYQDTRSLSSPGIAPVANEELKEDAVNNGNDDDRHSLEESSDYFCESRDRCSLTLVPYVGAVGGKGIGYNKGYYTLGAVIVVDTECRTQTFLDMKGHLFSESGGKGAGNAGIGIRYHSSTFDSLFGANLFYDYRKDDADFQQIGVGLEALNCMHFDFRLNGYIPVGKKKTTSISRVFKYPFGGFESICIKDQNALGGVDLDIESSLQKWCPDHFCCFDVYMNLGLYYRDAHSNQSLFGVKGGIGIQYADYLSVEVRTSYDRHFKWRPQGVITLSIPFDLGNCLQSCQSYSDCRVIPVKREEIIPLSNPSFRMKNNWKCSCHDNDCESF